MTVPMTDPWDSQPWRRTWTDGRSVLVVEHDVDGRVRIAVDDLDRLGFTASLSAKDARDVSNYIAGDDNS